MSNAEKRTVATDALETLGTIITSGGRDAIHLAVEPVIAGQYLAAGDHVGLVDGKAVLRSKGCCLGIVDPFLASRVRPGEMFWLVVYPRQITSLRHVWEHPAFPPEGTTQVQADDPVAVSRMWIEKFSSGIPLSYETIMAGADEYVRDGEYLCFGGLLEGEFVPDEFWDHYERVTGKTVPERDRGSFFTCSC